ncbi:putative metalloprotease CJM1_0395 family protein [Salicola sp. Rm-C-2C1-2]|uniref:putative metalloprotease CJM1_0395 family protein n=1 Tax=Salicola sp. Rm-C-2C1-2 TaxID=3141321 RepID=UPI0032E46E02
MQLTSIQSAINNGGGTVTRSAATPGTTSGSVPPTSTSTSGAQPFSAQGSVGSAPPSRPVSSATRGASGGGVQVSISEQARQQSPQGSNPSAAGDDEGASELAPEKPRAEAGKKPEQEAGGRDRQEPDKGSDESSPAQQSTVQELRRRDQQVRQHEQAHQVLGGQYAGAATYTYQRGPDGQLYAVGGQVSIDSSPIPDDLEATINKMQTVRSAALAPAEPSPQDIRVAQEATRQLLQARSELRSQRQQGADAGEGETQSAPGAEAAASDRSGGDDARISLFRNVDGIPATNSTTSPDSGLRATA